MRSAGLGVDVPAGIVHSDPGGLAAAAEKLTPPLVLKAFGPGLLHKTEVGAVQLGLRHDELGATARQMTGRLQAAGLRPAGFLVEEQYRADGIELIVGLVERPPYGHLALLGIGGTLTEVIDRGVTRLAPLSPGDVEEMLQAFPAARIFDGMRGGPALDRGALAGLLAAVAGDQGLLAQYGSRLSELECNPVLLMPSGAVALDARLLLHEDPPAHPAEATGTDFGPLFRPRSIAVAGASASKQGFGNRSLAAYRAVGWADGLYALHPTATTIDGVPAVPSLGKIPGGVDYLLVTVAAAQTPALIEASAGQARFAQVLSGGFGETGGKRPLAGGRTAAGGAGRRRAPARPQLPRHLLPEWPPGLHPRRLPRGRPGLGDLPKRRTGRGHHDGRRQARRPVRQGGERRQRDRRDPRRTARLAR